MASLPWAAHAQKAVTASQSTAGEDQPAVVAPADTTFSAKDSLKLNSMLQDATKKPKRDWSTWRPDTKRAMWLAIVLPGAGQIYNRKFWKLPIIYGGFVGCIYAIRWNSMMYDDYSQAYLDIMDDDPNTHSYNQFLHLGTEINDDNTERYANIFKRRKDYYRRYRDLSYIVLVGVYALQIVDAFVDASLSDFDISSDLSMSVAPTVINLPMYGSNMKTTALGIRCCINF